MTHQSAPLLNPRTIGRALSDALRCPTCHKRTAVANTAGYRQPFAGETVTLKSHCACPGGPAAHLVPPTNPDAPRCTFCGEAPAIYAFACARCC